MPTKPVTTVHIPSRFLTDRKREFVKCRTFGHSWEINQLSEWKTEFSVDSQLSLICTSCKMQRRDVISPWNGRLISRSYVMPKGYELSKDTQAFIAEESMTLREAYRVELIARWAK